METEKYKILIADDEYWTREKIRRMLDWEAYGLVFLDPAADGEEVLKKMEEFQPDIVITDINMPYLNGVELLKLLRERYPEVVTFVISGYDDFAYVKDSFLAGSINYLLKPVSRIDLVTAVSKALELISRRRLEKEEILKTASFLKDWEFSQLLEKKAAPLVQNITVGGSMDFAGVTLILLKIHNMKNLSGMYEYDRNRLSFAVKTRLQELLDDEKVIIFNYVYRSNEFIIVSEKTNWELRTPFQKITAELEKTAGSPVTAVFSDHSFSMDSLSQAYVQTISLLMSRTFAPVSQVLFPGQGQEEIRNHFGEQQRQELAGLFRRGQTAEAKHYLFHRIGIADCCKEGWKYLEMRQTVKRVSLFLMEMFALGSSENSGEDLDQIMDKELELLDTGAVCELLEDFIDNASSGLTGQGEGGDSIRESVRRAADYIRAHYYEPLTLGSLAEKYHVESSYFSRMFRKETGTNLLQFIAKQRIEMAKEYIRRDDTNLTEIAFLVGYDDYTYFNKVFRKMEGISPREYRNQNRK